MPETRFIFVNIYLLSQCMNTLDLLTRSIINKHQNIWYTLIQYLLIKGNKIGTIFYTMTDNLIHWFPLQKMVTIDFCNYTRCRSSTFEQWKMTETIPLLHSNFISMKECWRVIGLTMKLPLPKNKSSRYFGYQNILYRESDAKCK